MITAWFNTPAGLTAQTFRGTMDDVNNAIKFSHAWVKLKTQHGSEARIQMDKVAFWVSE
jgi:hypothetical protein